MNLRRLSTGNRRLPARFARRVVVVAPGRARPYDAAEWRDAIVVVARGEVELECRQGSHCRFARGSVLFLADLRLRALRNRGTEPAVLVAVSRRRRRPMTPGPIHRLIVGSIPLSDQGGHRCPS